MSVITSITLEGKPRQSPISSRDLVPYRDKLDRAAKKAGVPPLSSFSHTIGEEDKWAHAALGSPDTDAMDEDELDAYEDRLHKQTYRSGTFYAASDGLRSVDGLLKYFETHPTGAGQPNGPIVPVLKDLRRVLLKAKAAKQRFRLSVGV